MSKVPQINHLNVAGWVLHSFTHSILVRAARALDCLDGIGEEVVVWNLFLDFLDNTSQGDIIHLLFSGKNPEGVHGEPTIIVVFAVIKDGISIVVGVRYGVVWRITGGRGSIAKFHAEGGITSVDYFGQTGQRIPAIEPVIVRVLYIDGSIADGVILSPDAG